MGRRIKKAKIKTISLVPRGANKMRAIYKSDDNSVEFIGLTKDGEQGELLNVVYAPEHRDSQGDIASREVIKEMAYDFVANGANIDIRHDGRPLAPEAARLAETFIVHKSDTRFHGWTDTDGDPVDLEGAWASVIKIDDPDLRKVVRDGGWGVSMAGTAEVEHEKEDRLQEFARMMRKALGRDTETSNNEESEMDEKTLAETVAKSVGDANKPLLEAVSALTKIAETLKPEPKGKEDGKDDTDKDRPVFKGKLEDDEALRKHERELQLYELKKEHDLTTAEGLRKFREARTELAKSWEDEDKQAKVRKTNQTVTVTGDDAGEEDTIYLGNNHQDLLKAGAELIKARQGK